MENKPVNTNNAEIVNFDFFAPQVRKVERATKSDRRALLYSKLLSRVNTERKTANKSVLNRQEELMLLAEVENRETILTMLL